MDHNITTCSQKRRCKAQSLRLRVHSALSYKISSQYDIDKKNL
ncbi:hypothetical protein GYH30_049436 [Glycine max]|nr:hypothetical protein GYH30_049436 [Glycine max]